MRIATVLLIAATVAACGSARRGEPLAGAIALSPEGRRGESLFMAHCHQCHPKGESGLGPSINDKPLPEFLIRFQVRHGLGAMPSFGPDRLSDAEVADVVRYLRELRRPALTPR